MQNYTFWKHDNRVSRLAALHLWMSLISVDQLACTSPVIMKRKTKSTHNRSCAQRPPSPPCRLDHHASPQNHMSHMSQEIKTYAQEPLDIGGAVV